MASWKLIFVFTFAIKLIINVVSTSAPNLGRQIELAPLTSIRIDPTKNMGVVNGKYSYGVTFHNEKHIGVVHVNVKADHVNNFFQKDFHSSRVMTRVMPIGSNIRGAIIGRVEAQSNLYRNCKGEYASLLYYGPSPGQVTMEFVSGERCPIDFTVHLFGITPTN